MARSDSVPEKPGTGSKTKEYVTMNGTKVPAIGFGTLDMGGYLCAEATKSALNAGYRHIDTAMAYENEAVVGRAIEVSDVDREDIFLTTKIKGYPRFLKHDSLLEAAEGCLERLNTEYVDLLLIHWWNEDADMEEAFGAMNQLVDEGTARNIGVSNFSINQTQRAIRASDAPIFTNQIEYHPYVKHQHRFNQEEMLKFFRKNDILLTAYSPLERGLVVDDEVLTAIGEKYRKSAAQVTLRWLIQQENVITIVKSTTKSHQRENLDVFDFELTKQEMDRITALDGPMLYRINCEVNRFRRFVGPYVPDSVRARVPLL